MKDNYNSGDHRQRAGAYVSQLTGYRAFIPKPLPPNPSLDLDAEMIQLLSQAGIALGRLDGASEILPNANLFVAMYVNKEAVLSSQIEGTQASLIDVLAFEAAAADPGSPQDVDEVINYVGALNFGLERLNTLPLSLRLIREIHERLLAGVRGAERHPGEFRTSQNWIGHAGSTLATAQFVPPPPVDMMQALGDLELFLHAQDPIPPLLKIGMIHAQFETIHPFLDGNGRMGRLLITFYLCQQQVLKRPLLYLSHFFKRNRGDYYAHLQRVRDEGAWEDWLKFFLKGVYDVAQEATSTARNIMRMRERHRSLIAREFSRGAGAATQLLEFLYERPITTVNLVATHLGHTYASANGIIAKFVALGILTEMTQQERNRRFAYAEYLGMFTEDELAATSSQEAEESDIQRTSHDHHKG